MNRLIRIATLAALGLIFAGCSNEEPAPAGDPATVDEQPEAATQTAENPVASTEILEVVEESAAEAEPEDKAIVLAQADDVAAARNWKYKEGRHFTRMIPTQPTVGGADKIEVAEVFMYSCPHCFNLEGPINQWADGKDAGIRFVRIPAMFNPLAELHAQLYYTEVFLTQTGDLQNPIAFRNMVFDEFHNRGNRLTSQTAIQRLFARAEVSEDDFNRTWASFEVNQAMRLARDLARRYNITSVPMVVVNGKYRTDTASAGSYPNLIEVIDELTAREGLR